MLRTAWRKVFRQVCSLHITHAYVSVCVSLRIYNMFTSHVWVIYVANLDKEYHTFLFIVVLLKTKNYFPKVQRWSFCFYICPPVNQVNQPRSEKPTICTGPPRNFHMIYRPDPPKVTRSKRVQSCQVSSVPKPWLMISLGMILPNVLGMISQSKNGNPELNQPWSFVEWSRDWAVCHCSAGFLMLAILDSHGPKVNGSWPSSFSPPWSWSAKAASAQPSVRAHAPAGGARRWRCCGSAAPWKPWNEGAWWWCLGHCGDGPLRSRNTGADWIKTMTGWWFGIFSMFQYIGNGHPNWLYVLEGLKPPTRWWIWK